MKLRLTYLLLATSILFSQSIEEFPTLANRDTNDVRTLQSYAYKMYLRKPQLTLKSAQLALDISDSLEFESGRANSYKLLGMFNSVISNHSKAL